MSGEKVGNDSEEKPFGGGWDFGDGIDWNNIDWGDSAESNSSNTEMDDIYNQPLDMTEPIGVGASVPFKGQREAMKMPHVERTAEESERKSGGVKAWDEIKSVFEDERYEVLGHGTVSGEIADRIIAEGLKVGDKSGYFARSTDILGNFVPLSNSDSERMHEQINNWQHKGAKQIVIYRIPWQYKTAPGSSVVAYAPFYTGDDQTGVFDKEYAYGWYDAEKDEMHLNPDYHGDLDDKKDVAYLEREKARIDKIVEETTR